MAQDAPAPASDAPPIDYNAIIQQIMQGSGPVTGPAAPATPAVNPNLPITSLLGEAFGGGVSPLYPMSEAQQTQAGNAALLNFGINMLQNASGPVRHSLGQAVASGLLGAQGSLAGVREGQAQMLDVQNKQQQMGLEKIKTLLPLLMRQQAAGMPNPLLGGGGAPGGAPGSLAATGDPLSALPKDQALAGVVQRESGGRNVNTEILDPQTGKPASTASGYYQMVDGTWQEAARLAGLKNPPPRAIDASRADQDAAASALYDKRGLQDWARSAPATAAPAAPAPYKVASTGATPPPPSGAFTAPATAADDTFFPTAPKPNISTSPTLRGPGSAVPPTVTPPSPTIAQAGPPTVTPPAQPTPQQPTQGDQPPAPTGKLTFEQFQAQHPITIDPATYTVPVSPGAMADAIAAKQTAAQNLQQARLAGDTKAANQAQADYTIASQNVNKLQQDAQTKSLELRQAAEAKARGDQITLYNTEQDRLAAPGLEAQRGQQAIALEKLKGQQAIQQAGVTSDIQAGQKALEAVNATRDGANDTVNTLEMAKNLSKLAGTSGFLQQWPQVANALVRNNLLTPDEVQQLGAQRGLDAVMNKVILSMRAGSGMSRMTNFDLQFLQNTAPSSFTPEQMRPAMFAAIQTAATRQVEYADRVNELHASGMPVWQARQQADTDLGHMVKETPTAYPQGDPRAGQPMSADDQNKWIIRNVTPGTFYTQPNGALAIRGEPKQAQQ